MKKWIYTRKQMYNMWQSQFSLLWNSYLLLNELKDDEGLEQLQKFKIHKLVGMIEEEIGE